MRRVDIAFCVVILHVQLLCLEADLVTDMKRLALLGRRKGRDLCASDAGALLRALEDLDEVHGRLTEALATTECTLRALADVPAMREQLVFAVLLGRLGLRDICMAVMR